MNSQRSRTRILAISSGGGHWMELMRIVPAFDGAQITFATVNRDYREQVAAHPFYTVNDATRWNKIAVVLMAMQVLWIVLRVRPHVVVTSGAAPGYFAVRFGKWIGARTIWLDSIANVDELSMSGQMAGKFADLWLTQWPHLATDSAGDAGARRPTYAGAVL